MTTQTKSTETPKSLFRQIVDSFHQPPSPRKVSRAKRTLMRAKQGSLAAERALQVLKDAGQLPSCYSVISPHNGGSSLTQNEAVQPTGSPDPSWRNNSG